MISIMNYIYLATASAIIFACTIILVKYISKHVIKDFHSFFFWTYVTGLPFVFLIPLYYGFSFDSSFIFPIIIHSILLTLGQYFFSRGVYLTDASVIGPLFQLQSGFIVLLATIFLGEKFGPLVYGYLVLLILGAMLVSITNKTKIRGFFQKGVLYIIGMQVLHAGANIAVGFALKHTSNWQVLFYSFLFNSIIVTIYVLIKRAPITHDFSKIKWMLARAFLLVSATALLYKAFESNMSISATIGLLSSPLVFIISVVSAVIFPSLLEKQSSRTYLIRTIGMLMILFGAWKIMMYR